MVLGAVLDQGDIDARMGSMERGQGVEQPRDGAPVDHADGESTPDESGHLVHRVPNGLHRCEHRTGLVECRQTCCGQGGDTARTIDERGAEVALELPDLGADPRLADVHPFGCAGEVCFLSDGHKVLQLSKFHIHRF
jgi:hypothetical protein